MLNSELWTCFGEDGNADAVEWSESNPELAAAIVAALGCPLEMVTCADDDGHCGREEAFNLAVETLEAEGAQVEDLGRLCSVWAFRGGKVVRASVWGLNLLFVPRGAEFVGG